MEEESNPLEDNEDAKENNEGSEKNSEDGKINGDENKEEDDQMPNELVITQLESKKKSKKKKVTIDESSNKEKKLEDVLERTRKDSVFSIPMYTNEEEIPEQTKALIKKFESEVKPLTAIQKQILLAKSPTRNWNALKDKTLTSEEEAANKVISPFNVSNRYHLNKLLLKLKDFEPGVETPERSREEHLGLCFYYPGNSLSHTEVYDAVKKAMSGQVQLQDPEIRITFLNRAAVLSSPATTQRWAINVSSQRLKQYLHMTGLTLRGHHFDLKMLTDMITEENFRTRKVNKMMAKSAKLKRTKVVQTKIKNDIGDYTAIMETLDFKSILGRIGTRSAAPPMRRRKSSAYLPNIDNKGKPKRDSISTIQENTGRPSKRLIRKPSQQVIR